MPIPKAASGLADKNQKKTQEQCLGCLLVELKNLESHCAVFTHLKGAEKEMHYWDHVLTHLHYLAVMNGILALEDLSDLDRQCREYMQAPDAGDVLIDQLSLDAAVMVLN